ncbi:ClpP/crotonase-like domain-containing protein [Mycena rebaudengoi]|nr:ClpP/crotonase-like domain-containing protein [Mycena rebaudengoi]
MFHSLLQLSCLALLGLSASAARYPSFGTLQITKSSGVLNVVINNTYSSINLFDLHVQSDLGKPHRNLASQRHRQSPLPSLNPGNPNMAFPISLLWNITQLPQATIAVIEGRARGIGNEFLMSCDMRFATASPSVLLGQFEPSFGLNPGAGGAMYLSQLIGRGRTFEYVLASKDIDAVTAERYGWINKAFRTSAELKKYVHALAARIALFPAAGIAGTKAGINAVSRPAMDVIIQDAQNIIGALAATQSVQDFEKKFIAATNNQSIGELELNTGRDLETLFT